MKPFTTYEQQIELLKSRGLNIQDENLAKQCLEKFGYFNIINGYKDAFLENRKNETYKKSANFQDIVDLYLFDKNLKNKVLVFILGIENTIKTIIAYEFAKIHGADTYLNANNYNTKNPTLTKQISMLILKIKECIETDKKEKQYDCLKHYRTNHNTIPIWVLFNYLTFGNVSKFYSLLQTQTKKAIATHISQVFNFDFNTQDFYTSIRILVNLRNLCAHNQRLYDYTTKFTFTNKNKIINAITESSQTSLHNINLLILLFKIFAPSNDFIEFAKFLNEEINNDVENIIKIDTNLINLLINE